MATSDLTVKVNKNGYDIEILPYSQDYLVGITRGGSAPNYVYTYKSVLAADQVVQYNNTSTNTISYYDSNSLLPNSLNSL
jgi:hypothetical protein